MRTSPLTTSIRKSYYNGQSREGRKVERLIIHHTTATNLASATSFMQNKNSRSSCSTYLLGKGEIIALIGEEYRPSSTGRSNDYNSITIELLNSTGAPDWRVLDKDLENVAKLLADFSKRYGWGKLNRTNVRMHRDFSATACPGPYVVPRIDSIIARANEILGEGGIAPAPAPAGIEAPAYPLRKGWYFGPRHPLWRKKSVSGYHGNRDHLRRWQQRMKDRGWHITPDGLYGPNTANIARLFQAEKGLTVDGLIGPETWGAAWTEPVT